MANFSGKLSYNDGNVAAGSAPLLPPPAADCRQDPFVAASHNSQLDGALMFKAAKYRSNVEF